MADRIVVLTGGVGCGKSAAATEFEALGVCVVDADALSHELTTAGGGAMQAIREGFGQAVINPDGSLNRAAMREVVFRDSGKRAQLEAILHPLIQEKAKAALAAAPGPYAVYVVPLWQEKYGRKGSQSRSSAITPVAVIAIDCAEETQIQRVMARSGLSQMQVQAIMSTQVGRKERQALADYVIDNEGSQEQLKENVAALHSTLVNART